MTGHVTLKFNHVRFIYLFLTMLGACLAGVVVECKAGMLVVAGLILGQVKNFFG